MCGIFYGQGRFWVWHVCVLFILLLGSLVEPRLTLTLSQPPECLDHRSAPPHECGKAMEGDPLQAQDVVPPSAVSSYGVLAEKSRQGNQPHLARVTPGLHAYRLKPSRESLHRNKEALTGSGSDTAKEMGGTKEGPTFSLLAQEDVLPTDMLLHAATARKV